MRNDRRKRNGFGLLPEEEGPGQVFKDKQDRIPKNEIGEPRIRRRRLTPGEQQQFDRDYRGTGALEAEYWEPWRLRGLAAETRPDREEELESRTLLARARGDRQGEADARKALFSYRSRQKGDGPAVRPFQSAQAQQPPAHPAPEFEPLKVDDKARTKGERPSSGPWSLMMQPDLSDRGFSEYVLRGQAGLGRMVGLEDAPDALDHFLDRSGRDVILSREEARQRRPVQLGEQKNRDRFLERIVQDRSAGEFNKESGKIEHTPYNYYPDLMTLKDGQTVDLLPKPTAEKPNPDPDDYDHKHDWPDHLRKGDIDEYLATGDSAVISTAENGFTATRKGGRITVEGVVTHTWDDPYDFHGGSDSRLAEDARDNGQAREYNLKSRWQEKMTATYRIEGKNLTLQSQDWVDINEDDTAL